MTTPLRATGGVRCFSPVVDLRCQGLSQNEEIVSYALAAVQVLLVPVLLALAWSRPRAPLPFLALDIVLFVGIASWDFAIRILDINNSAFQMQDLILGILSGLPVLAFLLFALAIWLGDVRPALPPVFKSRPATHALILLFTPLVPGAFVGALLGAVLSVAYDGQVLGFTTRTDETTSTILSIAGAGATSLFLLFPLLCLFLLSLRPGQWPSSRWTLLPLAGGLALAIAEMMLLLPSNSFTLIILRRGIRLASRISLVVGVMLLYLPVPSRLTTDLERTHHRLDSDDGHAAIATAAAVAEKNKRRPTPLKLKIGAPVQDTFRRLSVEATRDFYTARAQARGEAERPKPIERVVFRTPARRAPQLSFAGSTFDSAALDQLAEVVRRRDNPEPSPRLPLQTAQTVQNPAKKYTGSIYSPSRVSVLGSDLAQWPPPATASSLAFASQIGTAWASSSQVGNGMASMMYRDPPGRSRAQAQARQQPLPLPGFEGDFVTRQMPDNSPVLRGPRMAHPFAAGADLDVPISAGEEDLVRIRDIPRYRTGDTTVTPTNPQPQPPTQTQERFDAQSRAPDLKAGSEGPMGRRPSGRRKPVPPLDEVIAANRRLSRVAAVQQGPALAYSTLSRSSVYSARRSTTDGAALSPWPESRSSSSAAAGASATASPGSKAARRETDPNLALDPRTPASSASPSSPPSAQSSSGPSTAPDGNADMDGGEASPMSDYSLSTASSLRRGTLFFVSPKDTPDTSQRNSSKTTFSAPSLYSNTVYSPGANYASGSASRRSSAAAAARDGEKRWDDGTLEKLERKGSGGAAGRRARTSRTRTQEDERQREWKSESMQASLRRLQRDTGVEFDPGRLDDISENERGATGRFSLSTLDSEDLTPRASGLYAQGAGAWWTR